MNPALTSRLMVPQLPCALHPRLLATQPVDFVAKREPHDWIHAERDQFLSAVHAVLEAPVATSVWTHERRNSPPLTNSLYGFARGFALCTTAAVSEFVVGMYPQLTGTGVTVR